MNDKDFLNFVDKKVQEYASTFLDNIYFNYHDLKIKTKNEIELNYPNILEQSKLNYIELICLMQDLFILSHILEFNKI